MAMNRPSMAEILKPGESYYSLVVAVAKRARELVDNACDSGEIIAEKPVSLAVDEFAKNHCKLVEVDDIGDSIE